MNQSTNGSDRTNKSNGIDPIRIDTVHTLFAITTRNKQQVQYVQYIFVINKHTHSSTYIDINIAYMIQS